MSLVDALPILAYKVADAQFDIASAQSFISLRDQAVRVRTLLTAMQEAKLFDAVTDERKVLVVGAGYAGVNAALRLAERKIKTMLVDVKDRPFHVQHGCSTRFLSLTQYDWPGLHYAEHDYPLGLSPTFIEYAWLGSSPPPADHLITTGVQSADQHAADWQRQFMAKIAPGYPLSWRPQTRFLPGSLASAAGGVSVELEDITTGKIKPYWFDYIFYAVGFGTDGGQVPVQGGGWKWTRAFWENDDLATNGISPPGRILISGGGDGALQDFIRVMVDPGLTTACEVLSAIIDGMQRLNPAHGGAIAASWTKAEALVTYAEMQAGSATAWSGEDRVHVWSELHRLHCAAAIDVANAWSDELFSALTRVVDRVLPTWELTLVLRTEVPGKVYALNRFLFILLSEYVKYVEEPDSDFFGKHPRRLPLRSRRPRVQILPRHELDLRNSLYDPGTGMYQAEVVDLQGSGSQTFYVDELIVRHGTMKPPPLGIRVGIHTVGLELGRIRLPFAAIL